MFWMFSEKNQRCNKVLFSERLGCRTHTAFAFLQYVTHHVRVWCPVSPLPSDCVRDGYLLLGRLSNVLARLSLPPWVAWYSVLPLRKKKQQHRAVVSRKNNKNLVVGSRNQQWLKFKFSCVFFLLRYFLFLFCFTKTNLLKDMVDNTKVPSSWCSLHCSTIHCASHL